MNFLESVGSEVEPLEILDVEERRGQTLDGVALNGEVPELS